jgi:hypothetical protein
MKNVTERDRVKLFKATPHQRWVEHYKHMHCDSSISEEEKLQVKLFTGDLLDAAVVNK